MITVSLKCRGLRDNVQSALDPDPDKAVLRNILGKGAKITSNVQLATKGTTGGEQYLVAIASDPKDAELVIDEVELPKDANDITFNLCGGLHLSFGDELFLHLRGKSIGEFVNVMGNLLASLLQAQRGLKDSPLRLMEDEERPED